MDYSYLKTCGAMTDDDFCSAVSSPDNTESFLVRVAKISQPNSGVGRILHFFVRLAHSDQMRAIQKDEFEEFAIQVNISRDAPGRFIVRLAATAGADGRTLYKVSVYCDFEDFLQAARDREMMNPFICSDDSREDYLFFEATQLDVQHSNPPPAYKDAEARLRELDLAGMLKPSQMIPTMPPPEEEDPVECFADALVGGVVEIPKAPPPPQGLDENPPSGLIHALIEASELPPPRKKFDSLADEARDAAGRAPSLPVEPRGADSIPANGIGDMIGRLSLVQVPASMANQPTPRPAARNYLNNRPETVRPPGIEEAAEEEDSDVDSGWGDIELPLVGPKGGE